MIIGLAGYAGSGKDTVAEYLIKEHGFVRLAFADKVRELAYALNPDIGYPSLSLTEVVDDLGWDEAKKIKEVREYLQNLGTECREVLGKDTWINALSREHWELLESAGRGSGANVVITDVRFENEARFIASCWGQVWRVTRPGTGPVNGHISESEMDGWQEDFNLINGGTIGDLHSQIEHMMGAL